MKRQQRQWVRPSESGGIVTMVVKLVRRRRRFDDAKRDAL